MVLEGAVMRIAALQMTARAGDVAGNLAAISAASNEASAAGAAVLVAPELAVTGYGAGPLIRELAEPADGAQLAALAAIAGRENIVVVAGVAERADGRIYNSAALVEPSGRRTLYRKRQLFGDYERALFAPGEARSDIVEIAGCKAGLLICYDVEFPEAARALAMAGADLILVPTALPESGHAALIAETLVRARAFENQAVVVYANHAGADQRFVYAGRSAIVMPDGRDGARAPATGARVLIADYEPAEFAASRAENPYLTDLRAEIYPGRRA
jgi:predicted amidohydrolase